jgi:nucleoside-diphosphate-sugar epimerase
MDEVAFSTGCDTTGETGSAGPSVRILVTGIRGFLGAVLEKQALDGGWVVTGLDMDLYRGSTSAHQTTGSQADFQQLQTADLQGYQAIVHLAAISSDAACDLRPRAAARINGTAAVELARRAKEAGVPRFVFASTCSVYGSAPDRISTERSRCAPISNYARSKLEAEYGILAMASTTFAPVILRFATLYGLSPNLRTDLVVNSMVTSAWMSGEIGLHGSGEQSRPLVEVNDAASTVLDVLKAGDEEIRGQIFNVTDESTGYSVADIAELVRQQVPGSRIVHHQAATDRRHYMADGSRLRSLCPRPSRSLEDGIAEVSDALRHADWQRCATAQESNRARRLSHLLERGELTDDLRWCG